MKPFDGILSALSIGSYEKDMPPLKFKWKKCQNIILEIVRTTQKV